MLIIFSYLFIMTVTFIETVILWYDRHFVGILSFYFVKLIPQSFIQETELYSQ